MRKSESTDGSKIKIQAKTEIFYLFPTNRRNEIGSVFRIILILYRERQGRREKERHRQTDRQTDRHRAQKQ